MTTLPTTTAPLASGAQIPLLGFGTWQLTGPTAEQATVMALEVGYRHLDTATVYGNEAEIGRALASSGLERDQIFVTSKCPPDQASEARQVLEASLQLLGVDALDLWLIHWNEGSANPSMWATFVQAQADGLVRDIGVSNHSLAQIDELEQATGVRPAVNQIKWSPLLFDQSVLDGHAERAIVIEGYSGLKGGTMDRPAVREIATRLGRTPAQVLIAWQLQQGVVAIPKSTRQERIHENADVADLVLSEADRAAIDAG